MSKPIGGAFKSPQEPVKILGAIQRISGRMRRYAAGEEVDYVIVGVGAAGGVLLQRLARAGFRVIGFEAGPFWDTERDWVSDETGSHKLYWNDLRITGGTDPLSLGDNNSGKGVGGGTVHWAAFAPRFHPSDFRVYTEDGVGADWPISYWDLKPYYELLEREIPVAGRLLSLGRSAWLSLWAASDRRSGQRLIARMRTSRHTRLRRRTRGNSVRLFR